MPRYQEFAQIGERLMRLTRNTVDGEKRAAIDSARFWSNVNIVVSLLAVAFLLAIKLSSPAASSARPSTL